MNNKATVINLDSVHSYWYNKGWQQALITSITFNSVYTIEYKDFLEEYSYKDNDVSLYYWLSFMKGVDEYIETTFFCNEKNKSIGWYMNVI